jgi:lysophospholipase L1-like esterase
MSEVSASHSPSRRAVLGGFGAGIAASVLLGTTPSAEAANAAGSPSDSSSAVGPAYLPTSAANVFELPTSSYNYKSSNTRVHRAGLAAAASGASASQLFIGDSLTAGCIGGTSFDRLNAWPRLYSATLANLGIPSGGTGLVRIVDGTTTDARWTVGNGWVGFTTCAYAITSGATATMTSDVSGTCVAVSYVQGVGGGGFTVSIDGAAGGPGFAEVSTAGATKAARLELTGLADVVHSVTITTTSAAMVVIVGVEVFETRGLMCHNIAQSGSRASGTGRSSWSDTTTSGGSAQPLTIYNSNSAIYGQVPATVHCALGVNDLIAGATPSAVTAGLSTIREACGPSDFFLYLEPQPNAVAVDDWLAYATALYSLADDLDVPLFDLQDRLGGYASEMADGLAGDSVAHLNRAGYCDWGRSAALASSR